MIRELAETIKQNLYDNFPYGGTKSEIKHKDRGGMHIRDRALGINHIIPIGTNAYAFEIGNEFSEANLPYYHILEDAEVIMKRGRSTKKSRGSQALVPVNERDYGIYTRSGKSTYNEYRKNVRGARSRIDKASKTIVDSDGVVYKVNRGSDYYYNKHYHFIERTLDATLPFIAQQFGARLGRTQIDNSISIDFEGANPNTSYETIKNRFLNLINGL